MVNDVAGRSCGTKRLAHFCGGLMIGTSLPAQQTDRKAVALTNRIALETRLLPTIAGRRTEAGQSARDILLLALLFPLLLAMSSCHTAAATTPTTGVAVTIS